MPKRTRLFAKDYVLDIVEVEYREKLYYYTIHDRANGEIVTLGHERTMERAQAAALFTFRALTGKDLTFESAEDASAAS